MTHKYSKQAFLALTLLYVYMQVFGAAEPPAKPGMRNAVLVVNNSSYPASVFCTQRGMAATWNSVVNAHDIINLGQDSDFDAVSITGYGKYTQSLSSLHTCRRENLITASDSNKYIYITDGRWFGVPTWSVAPRAEIANLKDHFIPYSCTPWVHQARGIIDTDVWNAFPGIQRVGRSDPILPSYILNVDRYRATESMIHGLYARLRDQWSQRTMPGNAQTIAKIKAIIDLAYAHSGREQALLGRTMRPEDEQHERQQLNLWAIFEQRVPIEQPMAVPEHISGEQLIQSIMLGESIGSVNEHALNYAVTLVGTLLGIRAMNFTQGTPEERLHWLVSGIDQLKKIYQTVQQMPVQATDQKATPAVQREEKPSVDQRFVKLLRDIDAAVEPFQAKRLRAIVTVKWTSWSEGQRTAYAGIPRKVIAALTCCQKEEQIEGMLKVWTGLYPHVQTAWCDHTITPENLAHFLIQRDDMSKQTPTGRGVQMLEKIQQLLIVTEPTAPEQHREPARRMLEKPIETAAEWSIQELRRAFTRRQLQLGKLTGDALTQATSEIALLGNLIDKKEAENP